MPDPLLNTIVSIARLNPTLQIRKIQMQTTAVACPSKLHLFAGYVRWLFPKSPAIRCYFFVN